MGAVQAQDYLASQWALGVRLSGAPTAADVETPDLVRMHALRGTWQWVAREDVRWLLDLVGALELKAASTRHRGLGLTDEIFKQSRKALEHGLRGGAKTRAEVKAVLDRAKVRTFGPLLMHLLWAAELQGVITTGPTRDTYQLLDERIPPAKQVPREEALAELAKRYVTTRGPATVKDFQWWSGLNASEAKRGWEAAGRDVAFHRSPGGAEAKGTWLLPAFDEYLISYQCRDAALDPKHVKRINAGGGLLSPVVVVDGEVVGTWSRKLKANAVEISVRFFRRSHDLDEAAQRYASFLEREAKVASAVR
jgi:hypothetical protein